MHRGRGVSFTYEHISSFKVLAKIYNVIKPDMHWPVAGMPHFFEIDLVNTVCVCVYVCVCVFIPEASNNYLHEVARMMCMIWNPYIWLNIFYSFSMATIVGIISRCGITIEGCHRNQPNKSTV